MTFPDIAIDNLSAHAIMQIRIKESKTDPFRKGVEIYIRRTQNTLCTIAAMLQYLSLHGDSACPLFHFEDSSPLTCLWFVLMVHGSLDSAGIPRDLYAGHSFCIGAVTTAALCIIPDSTIQLLGRWQSSAYLLYICMPRENLAAITRILSLQRVQSSLGTPHETQAAS